MYIFWNRDHKIMTSHSHPDWLIFKDTWKYTQVNLRTTNCILKVAIIGYSNGSMSLSLQGCDVIFA